MLDHASFLLSLQDQSVVARTLGIYLELLTYFDCQMRAVQLCVLNFIAHAEFERAELLDAPKEERKWQISEDLVLRDGNDGGLVLLVDYLGHLVAATVDFQVKREQSWRREARFWCRDSLGQVARYINAVVSVYLDEEARQRKLLACSLYLDGVVFALK